jgi:hypothetical protein
MIVGIENHVHGAFSIENDHLFVSGQGIPSPLGDPHIVRPDGLHGCKYRAVSDGIVRIRTRVLL